MVSVTAGNPGTVGVVDGTHPSNPYQPNAPFHSLAGAVTAEPEFGLFGSLLVRVGGAIVPIPRGKQRALLAALLLNANQVVSLDYLAEVLWGAHPPRSVRVTVQNYVKRLRQALVCDGWSPIVTQPPGYLIVVSPGALDISRFEGLLRSATRAVHDRAWDRAERDASAALALWRGEALADVPSDLLAIREVPRLDEMRLRARELRIDASLHLGRHADGIAELRRLTAEHPLREPLHGLLMTALYLSGQRGAALAAYTAARRVLVAELGAEPTSELRELHQRILTADPGLAPAFGGVPGSTLTEAGSPHRGVPRQLPVPARHFVGRTEELRDLTEMLNEAGGESPGTPVISAIGGTAGVGKTALAVRWAHQVASSFPDGQLYVNLRGYGPDQPVPPSEALAGFLRALGVPGKEVPAGEPERAARFRSLVAGRRILIVIDNAADAAHARPLLPGTAASVVLVTSRDSLAGLVARDDALRLDLDVLPPSDAVGLLRSLIGSRVDADIPASGLLASQCSRLPLALRVAAEIAAARPDVPVSDLAGELADEQRRLDLLDAAGDQETAVRAVFSWSYRHLEPPTARAFRLLGLCPCADLDWHAAAALTGSAAGTASLLLDRLFRAHLIYQPSSGRWSMHDLLQVYAAEQARREDPQPERSRALTRLLDYYLCSAAAAINTLFPADRHARPTVTAPPGSTPLVTEPAAARSWLDAERANLVAIAAYAADHGWPNHATRLARTVFRYLDSGGYYTEAIVIHSHARRAARLAGDRAAEASALRSLALVDVWQGRFGQATGHLNEALALCRQAGDLPEEARALRLLGNVCMQQGNYQQAAAHIGQSLALYRRAGDRAEIAPALGNLGVVESRQGRLDQAAQHLTQALDLCRQIGDQASEAHVLGNLGVVDQRLGRNQQATEHLEQALRLFRQAGNRTGEAHALTSLGDVDRRERRYQRAVTHQRAALRLFREFGDRSGEAEALNGLGAILFATGRHHQACTLHKAAVRLASQIGEQAQLACARDGLAACHRAIGDIDEARRQWELALEGYLHIGAPEAALVRAQLMELTQRQLGSFRQITAKPSSGMY